MTDERSPEQILTGLANELKPDIDRAVAELGREQVLANINAGIAKLDAIRIKGIVERLDLRNLTPDEARERIRDVLKYYPPESRFVYPALADKAYRLLRAEYTDEIRDWHALIRATQAKLGDSDKTTVERLNVLADLLRAAIKQAEIERAASVDTHAKR